jgi:hypothetical protein
MNIFVEFDPWSRLGNRMFQYAFGHILAGLRPNRRLYTNGLPNFNLPSSNNIPVPENPTYTREYGHHYTNFDLFKYTDRDIVVNSFLQKSRYYLPYREDLKFLFSFERKPINENSLVLHVRETDYQLINCFLGYYYYKALIDQSGFTDVLIVTDNSDCDTVKRLVSDGCRLNSEGNVSSFSSISDNRSMLDFYTLANSPNIALSQSSFSWWAAFLGDHKKIIFPYTNKHGMWKINPEHDDVDLYFDLGNSIKFIHE